MGSRLGAVRRCFVLPVVSLWAYLCFPLFRVFRKLFFRWEELETSLKKLDGNTEDFCSNGFARDDDVKSLVSDSGFDELNGRESPKFSLSFKFPTFEEFMKSNRFEVNSEVVSRDDGSSEEEEFLSCSDREPCCEHDNDRSSDRNSVHEQPKILAEGLASAQPEILAEGLVSGQPEILAEGLASGKREYGEKEDGQITEDKVSEGELLEELKGHIFSDKFVPRQFKVLSEKDVMMSDSDTDSMTSSHDFSIMSRLLDSSSDGFFSDGDVEDYFRTNKVDTDEDEDLKEELIKLEESLKEEVGHDKSYHISEEDDLMEELNKLGKSKNKVRQKESSRKPKNQEEAEEAADSSNSHSLESSTSSESTAEPENRDSKMEAEWEHQELIEQLKMEVRKVKATGLPTIAEGSEPPRIMDDLKPLKIDVKLYKVDQMSELHKVYKSYRERMRKLDILNYQKMYALGFLLKKDPFKAISGQKHSTSSLGSILCQTLRLCREEKNVVDDQMTKFARELHDELETVYVGQMCLSWEFLQWQYEKALDLWLADPHNLHRYNEVANEFQQLQVLMQRFLENEPFEGPRVQYYVKSRYFLRGLVQVPVIREDNLKGRKISKLEGKREFIVSSDVLVEILEESIRIFWRFIRADKDSNSTLHKGRKSGQPELQDPADMELFSALQATLQKNEKKLKEVLKGGNCILRKFKKRNRHDENHDPASDQVQAFFSQVDMKLVRRVLSMSRLTSDQLAWCEEKLSRIKFVSRQIHVEPSFLLFPC